jgi:hypothetical protein
MDNPALYFFLRTFVSLAVLIVTFVALSKEPETPFLAYGLLIAAVSLITPSQAGYHQILFVPAVLAAIRTTKDIRVQTGFVVTLALICSDYMGATARWDSGWQMFFAFPRVWFVLGLWLLGVWYIIRAKSLERRTVAIICAAVVFGGVISASIELDRWRKDETDGAQMVRPAREGFLEIYPRITDEGLTYLSLGSEGFAVVGSSGVRETVENVVSPDGKSVASAEWVNGRYRIVEWNRETQQTRVILEGAFDYRYPAYSPDGRWLAFSTNESGNWNIARRSVIDGHREFLTSSLANDYMPTYSEDGKEIYFASDRRRGYRFSAIYRIRLS